MAKTFQDLINEGQAKILGIVSIVPMDDWNADTQYQKLNLVRHNGAAYLAKGRSKNVEPGVTQDWQNSWMLAYLDGILSPDGTYPDLTAGRVMHALMWGNKTYDGSSAQTITAADLGLADVYKPQGSIAYSALPATPSASNYGYVWNITDDFTTDSRFIEGAGKKYSAGTNVGVIEQNGAYYYDILGNFVDLSNYATVASLNAEITRAKAAEQANATAAANAQNTANSKYTKPSSGIPKSDLAQAVQDSLAKADSALQSAPVTSVNGKTGAVSLSASDVGAATSAQGTKADQAATDIANIENGTTVVGKAASDEDGNNIPDTYAKQNGSYPTLGAGYVANALTINGVSYNGSKAVTVGFTDFSDSLAPNTDSYTYCEFQQGAVKGLRLGNQCIIQGRVKCIDFHWANSGFIKGAPRGNGQQTGRWWLDTMEDGGTITINNSGSVLYFTRSGSSGTMYAGEYISFFIMYNTMDAATLAALPAILFETVSGVVLDTAENRLMYSNETAIKNAQVLAANSLKEEVAV